jgi:L-threonylcarbamoyladenylate synthase
METKILNQKDLQVVVDILRNGGLVAFATDTVFGLAALANHHDAVKKLITIKQRPDDKPFPMMVSSLDHIESVALMTSRDRKIITRWMPGALTIILNKKEAYLDDQQKQFASIGIRMPNNTWILELIQKVGPLLVPSANISNEPPAKDFEEVYKVFNGKIEAIVVGKTIANGVPSTVLDATKETLQVIRKGEITLDAIQHDLSEYLPMTIALATDHGGFELKEKLKVMLEKWGY